ncbi:non-specific lipid-transfer protein 2-like [Sesamum indicum]|uniref:Non-specific lipid-transfer protein n=1 Tax=Sesamum indicum TaxID=4182 RepID=A0A6I9UBW5_SESIN|nr:non-specific lipid-transfer protein 2-like [Sesamum indicum]
MTASIKLTSTVLVAAMLVFAIVPGTEATIGCGAVLSTLSSCLPYVTDQGPLGACCGGVKSLYVAAKTTTDKQSVCGCLESLAGSVPNVDLAKAAGLPGQCGVNIPYKISPSVDCSKVK